MGEIVVGGKKNWPKPILFVIGFFLVYQPNFLGQSFSYLPMVMMAFITSLLILMLTPGELMNVFRNLAVFLIGISLSVLYYWIRAMLAGSDPRVLQNTAVMVNVLGLVIWLEILRKYFNFSNQKVLTWLLWLVVWQCIIAVIMMLDPSIRSEILSRTAAGVIDNQFIYGKRLYGISSDYTFFTPIYHSIIGLCAIYLGMNGNRRYYLFLPFCLFMIVMNGRTGLATLSLGFGILLFKRLFTSFRGVIQVALLVLFSIGITALALLVLQKIQPATYQWIIDGAMDTVTLIITGNKVGNYAQLAGSFLMVPVGIGAWLFGYGIRVYGENTANIFFGTSDIGYVNDLFMGGITYMLLLYGTGISYILSRTRLLNDSVRKSMLLIAFICIWALANYKGEAARSGLVLSSIIFLTYLFSTGPEEIEE
ncbi:polysaccharide polymerase [Lactiplantibacillus modestisalitolerans]|uniref:Polysaccharide polymerase n=1 Tax=Lactiplantibacillus modestisalitolerans TaxID=1457219 RepID=A0ABV5WUL4_9LACO|nr:polysaccharide polymerase [Lactiplantibacillus modestisalitolerans]